MVGTLDGTHLFQRSIGWNGPYTDNADHIATADFTLAAYARRPGAALVQYRGYDTEEAPANLDDASALAKRRAFYRYYVVGEDASETNGDADRPYWKVHRYERWTERRYALSSIAGRGRLAVAGGCVTAAFDVGPCDGAPAWELADHELRAGDRDRRRGDLRAVHDGPDPRARRDLPRRPRRPPRRAVRGAARRRRPADRHAHRAAALRDPRIATGIAKQRVRKDFARPGS